MPSWIINEHQGWKGNCVIKFCDPEWENIVFKNEDSYLKRILKAGFDGVYLDRIDTYQYWEKKGDESAKRKMIELVEKISSAIRKDSTDRKYVFVQNAPELGTHKDYLNAIDGIGQESAFYSPNGKPVKTDTLAFYVKFLEMFRNAGKTVLTVDYISREQDIENVSVISRALGFIPYFTSQELDRVGRGAVYD